MKNLNIKQRLVMSFVSVIVFFGLNLGAYFWGKFQKDYQLQQLNNATQNQITTLMLQKMIGDLKKQVSLVQQMTESAGATEVTKMSSEEISVFQQQVSNLSNKVDDLVTKNPKNEMILQFKTSYTELKDSWLEFYNLYGGPEHKKAMLTLIMTSEPASETSLMMLDELINASEKEVQLTKSEFDSISKLVNKISIGLFVVSLFVAILIALAIASYISKRLARLQEGAGKLRQGELEARVEIAGEDELANLGNEFNSMADSLLEARKNLEAAHQETLILQSEMEQIFDTVGQAIMTFDNDLEVNNLYSKETDRIMPGINPAGKDIKNVLFDEADIAPNIKSSLESEILISFDNDITQWELTNLEEAKEFKKVINGINKDFKVNFRPILDKNQNVNRILCQIEDITEIKLLQQEAQKSNERLQRMKFITNLGMNNYPHFSKEQYGFINQLIDFINSIENNNVDENKTIILKRALHTGKGNCNLLGCNELALNYHIAEDHLKEFLSNFEKFPKADISLLKDSQTKLLTELEILNKLFNDVYGEKTGDQSIEIIRLSWAENILLMIKNLPGINNETRFKIQNHIEQFQFAKSMECAGSLTKNYEVHVKRVADKMGMELGHIKFNGFDNTLLDETVLEHLNEAMVHSITNAVVHGYRLENLSNVKDKKVRIDISIKDYNDFLSVEIIDQGSGIDIGKVKKKAISLANEFNLDVNRMSDDEIIQLIFSPKLSTYDSEDQFAGRGIGMYAAFKAIESIGGQIKVETKWGEGTKINIIIPRKLGEKFAFVTIESSHQGDDEMTQVA